MISRTIYAFCNEDITKIENFNEAINDRTQVWECHHRLETELGKTADELRELGLYDNRPASELIFLTKSEHSHLHSGCKHSGWNGPKADKFLRGFCKPGNNCGFKRVAKWKTPTGEIVYMNVGTAHRYHKDWVELVELF